jgi:hypothetical protein
MMLGSFSMTSVLAQEHVIAEHRKMLIMSMIRNMIPNAMHRYRSHGGFMPPSHSSWITVKSHMDTDLAERVFGNTDLKQ